MKEQEYSLLIFKFQEYYENERETVLIASTEVKGKVSISLIKRTEDKINDTTEVLYNVGVISDDEGIINVDLTNLLTNKIFFKFYEKYKGDITISITIEIPKTEKYRSFVENYKITPNWGENDNGTYFENYNYYENDDTIILSPISDKITDLPTLRQTYKTIEDRYLLIKKQYESQIVGELDIEIDTTEDYEPKTFKNVITRLLEFQEGTLQPAIDYTKTAKLTTEFDRLTTIDKIINIISKMYPNITIEDGEGLPYIKK